MRYRALSPTGDYQFGRLEPVEFLINSPEAVAQAVRTRLLLLQGEWFLDDQVGTPYATKILGMHTQATHDIAIRDRILGTEGVTGIADYASSINTTTRALTVSATINTVYGAIPFQQVL